MIFFRPFIKILLFSVVLFFITVFLGIKFQWADYFFVKNEAIQALELPKKHDNPLENLIEKNHYDNPEILDLSKFEGNETYTLTKNQIEILCLLIMQNKHQDPDSLSLAVGNCVVSNF